jgi:hypothetical protein
MKLSMKFLALKFLLPPSAFRLPPFFIILASAPRLPPAAPSYWAIRHCALPTLRDQDKILTFSKVCHRLIGPFQLTVKKLIKN